MKGQGAFRVIRDSEVEIEEEAEDLVRLFETRAQAPPPRIGDPARDRSRYAGGTARASCSARSASPTTRCSWSTACWRSTRCRSSSSLDRPDLEFVPYNPRFPERIRDHGGDCFRGDPAEGSDRPPPLRIVRRGGAVPASGGARSERRRDQADALSHLGRIPRS